MKIVAASSSSWIKSTQQQVSRWELMPELDEDLVRKIAVALKVDPVQILLFDPDLHTRPEARILKLQVVNNFTILAEDAPAAYKLIKAFEQEFRKTVKVQKDASE